ncbi:tetraspanin-1-like [Hemiscyllium ocellatum]|uniref:tetraspanin-1-like n=1 Tax=Hemiscyllium ocellatum TaxID=170820 RepID=UPI002966E118|nr:tetraspanin-1-like [Hemiscyllium ocellatum]
MSCFKFLKMMMFCCNCIVFLGGSAILGVGVWVKVDGGSFLDILAKLAPQLKQLVNVGYLCIAIGAFLVLIGFLGCYGAVKENKCMLMIFFIIVLLIFIAQIAGAVVILAFSGLADIFITYIRIWAVKSIKDEYGDSSDITTLWDTVMNEFKCCGFNDFDDFTNSPFYNNSLNKYPKHCCKSQSNCFGGDINHSVMGCYNSLLDFLKTNTKILGIVALGICVLEFQCCGLNNYTDFIQSSYHKLKGRLYPKSCCHDPSSPHCDGFDTSDATIYPKGCFNAVITMIKKNSAVISGVAVGIAIIEMLAMVISLTLFINLFRIT